MVARAPPDSSFASACCYLLISCAKIAAPRTLVLLHPLASLSLCRPREEAPDSAFPLLWDGYSHPSNRTHQRLADALAYAMHASLGRLCAAGAVISARDKPAADEGAGARSSLRRCVPALTRLREPRERFVRRPTDRTRELHCIPTLLLPPRPVTDI